MQDLLLHFVCPCARNTCEPGVWVGAKGMLCVEHSLGARTGCKFLLCTNLCNSLSHLEAGALLSLLGDSQVQKLREGLACDPSATE